MKLTTKSEYSLIALIYLGRNKDKGFIKVEEVCKEYDISKKYLEQIFTSLKQARYVKTKIGAKGGYKIAKPTKDISVAEVVRLMDGALAPILSVSKYFFEHTPLEKERKVINFFKEIRDCVSKKLENLKISDLI